MKRILLLSAVVFCLALLTGCAAKQPATDNSTKQADLFTTSAACSSCHNKLTDASGADISFVTAWSGSVHSYATLDPYFLASVSHETAVLPSLKGTIEDTCATCHLPMARLTAMAAGESTAFLGTGSSNSANSLHALYKDAVSCMVCHQIGSEGLGTPASFTGGFQIDTKTTTGLRTLYGSFELNATMQKAMKNSIGYTAVKSSHLASSELCATCHTLYTQPVTVDGKVLNQKFPEQVPYLEWQQSSFAEKASCQSCHMPAVSGAAKMSTLAEEARSPLGMHTFTGGNAYLLGLMKSDTRSLESAAVTQLDVGIKRTTEQLQTKTANIAVAASQANGKISVKVKVGNLTGHKLPTAFPSRRAWLHVVVKDSSGKVVFESGAWQANGAITGNDNDTDATRFEPHYTTVTSADQVQIYEAILGDTTGKVTTGVIAAASYLKDNRLLPTGFDKAKASADTAVAGGALNDANFTGGQDEVIYELATGAASGPLTVKAELVYQSIGYRWIENLTTTKTAELDALLARTAKTPNVPVVLASQEVTVK